MPKLMKFAPLFVAATLGSIIATSAFAGAGVITTVVTPLQANVTYSVAGETSPPALVTYVGFTVSIANGGGNTINNVRFTGTAPVTDTAETAAFSSAEGATCTTTIGQAGIEVIQCTIGQLRAGQSFPTFAVFFKAPVKITNGTADSAGQDQVAFSGTTFYAEGTGGEPGSIPDNSTNEWVAGLVTLGTSNPTLVKSAVPKSGGTLFTGDGGVATVADKWTTSVKVPATASFTTAEISEALGDGAYASCSADYLICVTSDLTIPGTFGYLEITLRRDASTIKSGAKIANAVLYYEDTPGNFPQLADCQPGQPNATVKHCLASRLAYTKKNSPTPDYVGDWQFVVKGAVNGRVRW